MTRIDSKQKAPADADNFDFVARDESDPAVIGLLLPAVQMAKDAGGIDDFANVGGGEGESEYTLVELLEIRSTRRIDGEDDDFGFAAVAEDGLF